ncbi:cellulase family glycosylhydrolase [Microbulbifer mangrovi]|uniref:cellulase family glycosylhydrolase n=1 Tax=Microbulbifer mangrovi TaxID=927787 RepID=UPI001EFBFA2A|nr:cellulase family glycosylhydrolase [Microbulbifer mangrovi]
MSGLLVISIPGWAGFSIDDGRLLDGNGTPFVMRGVNHAHTWYPGRTAQALTDIANAGANTVRVVLASGGRWNRNSGADVAQVIAQCKANTLVCVLEVHDATGWGEDAAAIHISEAAEYWVSPDIVEAISGQEDYVLINIANEPFGNSVSESNYVDGTTSAIQRIRDAGLTHTIVVDASSWGQDWENYMRANAPQIFAADPLANVLFSVHMYQIYGDHNTVASYMQDFEDMGLPLIVGEFGHEHQGQPVDEDSILAEAQTRGIGYLGWSWSGNTEPYLDMALNWDPNNLSAWGERLFNGENGIAETAQCTSVFEACAGSSSGGSSSSSSSSSGSSSGSSSSSSSSGSSSGGSSSSSGGNDYEDITVNCVVESVNDWGAGFVSNVTIKNQGNVAIDRWEIDLHFPHEVTITNAWNINMSSVTGTTVSGSSMSYNSQIDSLQNVSFGMQGVAGNVGTPGCSLRFTR